MTIQPPSLVWTADMMRTLRLLHRDAKLSCDDMAKQMSAKFAVTITKNSCIGKARRMGLPVRGPIDKERVLKQPRPKMIKTPHKIDAPIEPEPEPAEASEPGISIYQLGSCTCRWPLGQSISIRSMRVARPTPKCSRKSFCDR